MISAADRAAIDAAVAALDVDSWAPLSDAERDLVSRALGPAVPAAPAPRQKRSQGGVSGAQSAARKAAA